MRSISIGIATLFLAVVMESCGSISPNGADGAAGTGGGAAGAGGGGGDGMACTGTHPLLDGGSRFCVLDVCYCSSNDTCYAPDVATRCCDVAPNCAP
jgi:hypothetical protein